MSHVNTLEVFDNYKAAGFDDKTARDLTNILEHSFMATVADLKGDFASSKVINIFASIIIAIGGFTLAKLWDLSHDMVEVKGRLTILEERIR